MEKKTQRSISHVRPENLSRSESWRELARLRREFGNAEAARRTGINPSTLRRWIKQHRIPDRPKSVKKAQRGIRKERKRIAVKRKRVAERPANQQAQQSIVFWSFASGPDSIPIARARLNQIVKLVVAGEDVPKAIAYRGDLDKVRIAAASPGIGSEQASESNSVAGDDYRSKFQVTEDGQYLLSQAFVRELIWLMNYSGVGLLVLTPDQLAQLGEAEPRPNATQYTDHPANIWSVYNYCKNLPAFAPGIDSPGFVITWDSAGASEPAVFQISVWLITP
jgi:transposase-like protein